eukprot:87231-Chlamydomonas_euryale.AAC.1
MLDPIVWGSARLGQAKGDCACKASLSIWPGHALASALQYALQHYRRSAGSPAGLGAQSLGQHRLSKHTSCGPVVSGPSQDEVLSGIGATSRDLGSDLHRILLTETEVVGFIHPSCCEPGNSLQPESLASLEIFWEPCASDAQVSSRASAKICRNQKRIVCAAECLGRSRFCAESVQLNPGLVAVAVR